MKKSISQLYDREHIVSVAAGSVTLEGNLEIPEGAKGIVLFAHGSGSSRHSPRNRYVAKLLHAKGMATLLIDLLTRSEEEIDRVTRHLRFDIGLLAERLIGATKWVEENRATENLKIGYFGASTGSAAALLAAAELKEAVSAIVSRGGRPDLAGTALSRVKAPTLLIVGGNDIPVIAMNQEAMHYLHSKKQLEIIPSAGHLFEEPGALEEVARLTSNWFDRYLSAANQQKQDEQTTKNT